MKPRIVTLSALVFALGCGDGDPDVSVRVPGATPEQGVRERSSIAPPTLTPEVRALIDEGNAAFELGDLEAALRSFEEAIAADSASAPAWFGAYMTWIEAGNTERAAEARARLTTLARPGFGDPHAGDPSEEQPMVDQTSEPEGGT